MSEQLNNPFSKVISLGNETGTITLQLTIGYGQAYSKPIAVNLGERLFHLQRAIPLLHWDRQVQ